MADPMPPEREAEIREHVAWTRDRYSCVDDRHHALARGCVDLLDAVERLREEERRQRETAGAASRGWEKDAAEVERLRAELRLAFSPGMYLDIQKVLDGALGTTEADGAGAGIVADVALVTERMKQAEAERDEARAELEKVRTRDEPSGAVLYDVIGQLRRGLDDHAAVREIERRLIHPLVARARQAEAKAARAAARRQQGGGTPC